MTVLEPVSLTHLSGESVLHPRPPVPLSKAGVDQLSYPPPELLRVESGT